VIRRSTAILAVLAFLAATSGASLALHLHDADGGHSPDRCANCFHLTLGGSAVVELPLPICTAGKAPPTATALAAAVPPAPGHSSPASPRAPPLV